MHVGRPEGAADLAHVHALAAEREGGVAGDHHELAEARQLGDHVVRDAVAEIDLLRVAAHVLERQHRDGRLFAGLWRRWPRRRRALRRQPVGSHGPGDVLQVLLAHILEGEIELARQLIVRRGGDQHASRRTELLQAGRHVHAIAQQVLALDHHVAEMHPDAQDNPALGRHVALRRRKPFLERPPRRRPH